MNDRGRIGERTKKRKKLIDDCMDGRINLRRKEETKEGVKIGQ